MKINPYLKIVRAKFLILSILIAFSSISLAIYEGIFNLKHSILSFLMLILLHISVNSLNAARDFHSGIDMETEKTPFSGGIMALVNEKISYRAAIFTGLSTLIMTLPIFGYFVKKFNTGIVVILFLVALALVLGYTDVFARKLLGEVSAGIGLGSLAVFSIFYFQNGSISPLSKIVSSLLFIPTFNLLLINEFPDTETDRRHGRKNIPIKFGREFALKIYCLSNLIFLTAVTYSALFLQTPITMLITVVPALLSLKYAKSVSKNEYSIRIDDMRLNVILTHSKFLLVGISLLLATLI